MPQISDVVLVSCETHADPCVQRPQMRLICHIFLFIGCKRNHYSCFLFGNPQNMDDEFHNQIVTVASALQMLFQTPWYIP